MFCNNCGTKIPDGANFCLKCGQPQKPNVQVSQTTNEQYETCEIDVVKTKGKAWFGSVPAYAFQATAIGVEGMYGAGISKPFFADWVDVGGMSIIKPHKVLDSLLKTLVDKLVSEGWQPLTRGQYWYSYRFQRRVKS